MHLSTWLKSITKVTAHFGKDVEQEDYIPLLMGVQAYIFTIEINMVISHEIGYLPTSRPIYTTLGHIPTGQYIYHTWAYTARTFVWGMRWGTKVSREDC